MLGPCRVIEKETGNRRREWLQHSTEPPGAELLGDERLERVRKAEPLFGERRAEEAVVHHDSAAHRHTPAA